MVSIMAYDGNSPLQPLIAELIGCSPKNQAKIAKVTKQAKLDLGITSKARRLPVETKIQIYAHLVELYSQSNDVNSVQIIPHEVNAESVETISQGTDNGAVEIYSQSATVNRDVSSHLNNFDNLRIAFYTKKDAKRVRQVISIDGYFINALSSIKVTKQDVPQWVQTQVNNWQAFDSKLPITRQVKYLIMREVVKELSGSDNVFYD